jgi:hypothetical protein
VIHGVYRITHRGYIMENDHRVLFARERWYSYRNSRMTNFDSRLLDPSGRLKGLVVPLHCFYEVSWIELFASLLPMHGNDHWTYSINRMRYCNQTNVPKRLVPMIGIFFVWHFTPEGRFVHTAVIAFDSLVLFRYSCRFLRQWGWGRCVTCCVL